jgi:hypothetical protein
MSGTSTRSTSGARRRTLSAAAILAVGLLALAGSARAVHVYVEPELSYATYPETFTVSVMAEDFDMSRGYTLDLTFDSGKIDFVAGERGQLFHDYAPPFGLYWSVQDLGNQVSVECLIIPEDECVAGPGEILRLTFAALPVQGETALHIASATVRDCEGAPIVPVVTSDGRAVVGPEAELFFDPDPKIVFGPEPFEVSLSVGPVDSLRGFQVYLDYDNTAVEFDSAKVGALFGGENPPNPLWWYVREESPTRVRVEGVILGPGLFVNGPGELIDLHFAALIDSGQTMIRFQQWHVWDVNTDEFYPVATDDGLVLIDYHLMDVGEPSARAESSGLRLVPLTANPGTTHAFRCEGWRGAASAVQVYDISGRIVREVTPRRLEDGLWEFDWDGRTATGALAPRGVYLLRVGADWPRVVAKVVVSR